MPDPLAIKENDESADQPEILDDMIVEDCDNEEDFTASKTSSFKSSADSQPLSE